MSRLRDYTPLNAFIMDKLDKDAVRKPPNRPHILKPHHIVVCTIITLIYPNSKIHTPSFMLHMLRLLLNEISEVGTLSLVFYAFQSGASTGSGT